MTECEMALQMKAMRELDEPMPQIGVFLYDTKEHGFAYLQKMEITPKQIEDFAQRGVRTIGYSDVCEDGMGYDRVVELKEDFILGQVVWNRNLFSICLNPAAKSYEEEISKMVELEFALTYFEMDYNFDNN